MSTKLLKNLYSKLLYNLIIDYEILIYENIHKLISSIKCMIYELINYFNNRC